MLLTSDTLPTFERVKHAENVKQIAVLHPLPILLTGVFLRELAEQLEAVKIKWLCTLTMIPTKKSEV